MPKICIKRPPKFFFFSEIEDFAALGTYIINYIRVLVPDDAYLTCNLLPTSSFLLSILSLASSFVPQSPLVALGSVKYEKSTEFRHGWKDGHGRRGSAQRVKGAASTCVLCPHLTDKCLSI